MLWVASVVLVLSSIPGREASSLAPSLPFLILGTFHEISYLRDHVTLPTLSPQTAFEVYIPFSRIDPLFVFGGSRCLMTPRII
jgi:hypothetical protein